MDRPGQSSHQPVPSGLLEPHCSPPPRRSLLPPRPRAGLRHGRRPGPRRHLRPGRPLLLPPPLHLLRALSLLCRPGLGAAAGLFPVAHRVALWHGALLWLRLAELPVHVRQGAHEAPEVPPEPGVDGNQPDGPHHAPRLALHRPLVPRRGPRPLEALRPGGRPPVGLGLPGVLDGVVPPVHGLPHLLDPPVRAPPERVQLAAQAAPPLEDLDAVREPRVPLAGRVLPVAPVPHLRVPLPLPQVRLPRLLRLCQLLDHQHPRPAVRGRRFHHQRRRAPHHPPPRVQLQLRAVLYPVGPDRGVVQASRRVFRPNAFAARDARGKGRGARERGGQRGGQGRAEGKEGAVDAVGARSGCCGGGLTFSL